MRFEPGFTVHGETFHRAASRLFGTVQRGKGHAKRSRISPYVAKSELEESGSTPGGILKRGITRRFERVRS
jgi:hypothetical protein